MGIRLLSGRMFTPADRVDAPRVVTINESLAKQYWPGENPVGRRVVLEGQNGPLTFEIVGVVADVRSEGLEVPSVGAMFFPIWQQSSPILGFAVRASNGIDPASLASQVRAAVWAVDPDQPVPYVLTMESLAAESMAFRRAGMRLAAAFGILALVLAAIGIYGVLSYSVTRRSREIGVRMALGATRVDVARGVIREAMTMTMAGCVIGVAAALVLMRFIAAVLYDTEAADPATYAAVAVILLAVAFLATWLPVRRATAVNPLTALRAD
jgi:putative ABC transport system permease protein